MVSNARGASYMSRPYTSSEALKWEITSSSPPMLDARNSTFYCYIEPPFATNLNEASKQKGRAVQQRNSSRYNDVTSPTQPHSLVFRRLSNARSTQTTPYPTKKTSWPFYNSLSDPHMQEYFQRRFGRYQTAITSRPCSSSRSQPNSSAASRFSQDHLRSRSQMQSNTNILYKIIVTTGNKKNCGTTAKVYITVNGTRGKISKTQLFKKKLKKYKNIKRPFRFSKDSTHTFKIQNPDIGDIKSILIENTGNKREDGWFLERIEITNTTKKKTWPFICHQWLSLYHSDGQPERKLYPHKLVKTEYEVVTVTGDVMGASTNANVLITLYGRQGMSKKMHLKSKKLSFQRGESDSFRVKTNCIDPLTKIHIEHDNTGFSPGWFLERVVVTNLKGSKVPYYFPCGKWLAKDEGDGSISRYIIGSKNPLSMRKDNIYQVNVYTGNIKGAGTDASVFITLFGEFSDSGECRLRSAHNNFERGKVDEFIIKCPCLGHLERIRIGHDDSGFGSGWFLDKTLALIIKDGFKVGGSIALASSPF